ncbi:MAG: copper amine oxidase N-terminal domain-containing protein [Armatimonadetes bacterium]|nr:copper amine oxidase N-terminal domain-containing protein [Armatimonadota bacterium]
MRQISLVVFVLVSLASTAQAQGIRVVLNDREMFFDQPPATIGGRLMVPLRGIFEGLNAEVLYDGRTRSIKATKGSTVVELTLGSREARLNGRSVYLDVPADTLGGRTMVPIRFVSESLGADVKWEGATRTVRISDQGSTAFNPQPQPQPQPQSAPTINQVIHNATGPLQVGDSLDVVMTGDPGGQASFQILGVTASITMRDVGNGRYEGQFTIPRGASVNGGVLTVRLAKNGRETIAESNRAVTIQTASVPPPNPTSSALTIIRLFPPANSNNNPATPTIGVEFAGVIGRVNVLQVDTQNFIGQAQQQGNQVFFIPTFNLAGGSHSVQVAAVDASGNPVTASWTFDVLSQPTNAGPSLTIAKVFPPANSTNNPAKPTIGVEFAGVIGRVNVLQVDNKDVIGQAQQQGNRVVWTPTIDLAGGSHSVRVTAADASGRPVTTSWTFDVPTPFVDNSNNFGLNIPTGWLQDKSNPAAALNLVKGSNSAFIVTVGGPLQLTAAVTAEKNQMVAQGDTVLSEGTAQISGNQATTLVFQKANGAEGAAVCVVTATNSYTAKAQSTVLGTDPQIKQELTDMLASFFVK